MDGHGWGDTADGVPIPPGAAVLLRPGSETNPLPFASRWPGEPNLLAVTAGRSTQSFLTDWRAAAGRPTGDIGFVGVGEMTRSAAALSPVPEPATGTRLRTVPDPTDVAAIERHVRAILDEWRGEDERAVVVVDSVTGLLDAAPERAVVAFAANLASLVADVGAVTFLIARPDECDPEAVERVRRACTDVVEATPEGWRFADPEEVPDRPGLPADELFSILADERRRQVLKYLDERKRATVGELADVLATQTGERTKLAGSLAHAHLPKLSDAGVVVYDADDEVVETTEQVDYLRPSLNVVSSWDRENAAQ